MAAYLGRLLFLCKKSRLRGGGVGNTRTKAHDGICGARTRKGTPCQQRAGWGTDHVGEGRCKLHGGKSTGPKDKEKQSKKQTGNKNALTTGEYESIIFDVLEEGEKELYYKINLDRLKQTDDEIRFTDIRLRRMMLRIKELQEHDYTVVSHKLGIEKGQPTDLNESEGTLGQIQNIEDAITRVQSHKVRLIDLKHKLEQDLGINEEQQKLRIEKLKKEVGDTEHKPIEIRLVASDKNGD